MSKTASELREEVGRFPTLDRDRFALSEQQRRATVEGGSPLLCRRGEIVADLGVRRRVKHLEDHRGHVAVAVLDLQQRGLVAHVGSRRELQDLVAQRRDRGVVGNLVRGPAQCLEASQRDLDEILGGRRVRGRHGRLGRLHSAVAHDRAIEGDRPIGGDDRVRRLKPLAVEPDEAGTVRRLARLDRAFRDALVTAAQEQDGRNQRDHHGGGGEGDHSGARGADHRRPSRRGVSRCCPHRRPGTSVSRCVSDPGGADVHHHRRHVVRSARL